MTIFTKQHLLWDYKIDCNMNCFPACARVVTHVLK